MPTVKFDSTAESTQFELLPDGDYPFEIVGADFGISTGPKTKGSENMELKVAFYKDATFQRKAAQWTEEFIFHPNCEWKLSVFTKCANMLVDGKPPSHGVEIEYTESTVIGLRGWATVRNRASSADAQKPAEERRRFNHVAAWITNKEKLARAVVKTAPSEDENLPF